MLTWETGAVNLVKVPLGESTETGAINLIKIAFGRRTKRDAIQWIITAAAILTQAEEEGKGERVDDDEWDWFIEMASFFRGHDL